MAAFINTNIASLNAQRNLTASQGSLQTSLQRLSSGLRINSAKDDAAGLAISSRFTTQIKGLDQAVRNANDGISLAQTGEGALGEVTNNLQRIRELAVQAGNATNSADDRAAIDLEVQQRLSEIDRTASQTAFNGQKILDGSFGTASFQIGANAGETINVGLSTNVRIAGMGAAASVSSGVALSTLMNSSTTPAVAGSYTKSTVSSFDFRNIAATAATYTTAVTPTDYSSIAATAAAYTTDTIGAGTTGQTFNVTVGGGSAFAVTLAGNTTNATDLAAEITGTAGYASADFTVAVNAGKLQFTAKTAGAGNIAFSGADASLVTAGSVTDTAGTNVDNTPNKTFTLTAPGGSALSVTLNSNITSAADLATAIQGATGYGTSGVVASTSGGNLVLTASAGGAGNIAVGGANASVITGGLVASGDVAGTAANDKRAGFSVDGNVISLTTDVTDQTGLVNAIRTQLNAAVGNSTTYTVAAAGTSGFSITSTTAGTTTPATVGTFTGAGSADFGGGTVVAGAAAIPAATLTLGAGDLSIQIGNSSAVAITGTFTNSTQLVNAINSSVQGVYASVNASNGKLDLTSSQDITLSGANAGAGATELAFATTTNAASGNLSTANVKTVAGANDIIQRVDNALSTVSTLRSTFGAVQNRFESVISNLSSTSENLSAARSRIQDADFASETATLTRGQILQQAGTAMLAQANSLPNGVLALLRG